MENWLEWHDYYEKQLNPTEHKAVDEAYHALTMQLNNHGLEITHDDRAEKLIAAITEFLVVSKAPEVVR